MLVSEEFRKCVTFLYADRPDANGVLKRVPVGTAFFVRYPISGQAGVPYLVTARHVIEGPGQIWIRVGTGDGNYAETPIDPSVWVRHPSTDVAAAWHTPHPSEDVRFISVKAFADREFVETNRVGEGDDVFFSGLFVGHPGKGVPQPIVRFGHISLMPYEPVRVAISRNPRTFANVDAYLVEARSWGGQSGSPAFLSFPANREMGGGLHIGGTPPFALLGLVQGMWKNPNAPTGADPSGEGVVEVNMGISVVIPAYKILEVLMEDKFKNERDKLEKQLEEGDIPPSAASVEEEDDEFQRFEGLTRRLVNTPKEDVDEKRRGESS